MKPKTTPTTVAAVGPELARLTHRTNLFGVAGLLALAVVSATTNPVVSGSFLALALVAAALTAHQHLKKDAIERAMRGRERQLRRDDRAG